MYLGLHDGKVYPRPIELCPRCGGTGESQVRYGPCPLCRGLGWVSIDKLDEEYESSGEGGGDE